MQNSAKASDSPLQRCSACHGPPGQLQQTSLRQVPLPAQRALAGLLLSLPDADPWPQLGGGRRARTPTGTEGMPSGARPSHRISRVPATTPLTGTETATFGGAHQARPIPGGGMGRYRGGPVDVSAKRVTGPNSHRWMPRVAPLRSRNCHSRGVCKSQPITYSLPNP